VDAVNKVSRGDVCDLLKQIMLMDEPFCISDLADRSVLAPSTVANWVSSLEGEGLLAHIGKEKSNDRPVNKYKRAGAFA
jgi:DNA-binding MarR family transcriptional regulator